MLMAQVRLYDRPSYASVQSSWRWLRWASLLEASADEDGTGPQLPPGQYLTDDFGALGGTDAPHTAGCLGVHRHHGAGRELSVELDRTDGLARGVDHADIHCVTRWSKLDTPWRGVSLDTLLGDVETSADFALVHSYGGYSTNLPLEDLLDGKAWVAYETTGGARTTTEGPRDCCVPHLYFWKSAKWVRGIELMDQDLPGFWEQLGYHDYGDPWREQRYQGD